MKNTVDRILHMFMHTSKVEIDTAKCNLQCAADSNRRAANDFQRTVKDLLSKHDQLREQGAKQSAIPIHE